jgi:hypothetical protein
MGFQDRPCPAGQHSIEIERAAPEAEEATAPAIQDEARLQMPAHGASSQGMGFRVDTAEVRSAVWLDAIAQASQQAPLRSGNGRITLFRVLLEGNQSKAVQLKATKLKGLGVMSGGGTYLQLSHGDFALMEHIHSTSRKNGEDLLRIGSTSHGAAEIRVPVPDSGALAVLGDVVLSEASAEQKGVLEATIETNGVAGLAQNISMRLGPIVVGGPYGETLEFDSLGRTPRIPLAPGTYKIVMPDFDLVKSRFTIELEPGERLQIHFRAKGPRVVDLLRTDRKPLPASSKR